MARAIEGLGRRAVTVEADVTRPDGVDKLTRAALDFGSGRIDILVNNAGGMVKRAKLSELTLELLEVDTHRRRVITWKGLRLFSRLGHPPARRTPE